MEKGIYPYRYKENWEKFIDASLPEKEDFEMKNLGEYHDMFVQSDTLFLAVLFETWNKGLEIYEPETCHFLTALALVWQAALKKTKVNLELLAYIDVLLKAEKGVRFRICHAYLSLLKTKQQVHEILWFKKESYVLGCE